MAWGVVAGLGGCSYLPFLKPPTVPRERGRALTERGPAFDSVPAARSGRTAGGDWLTYNRTLAGDRYSPLREITRANVATLRRACRFETGERTPMESGPIAVAGTYLDGRLFRGAHAGRVYALDAGTGRELWNVRAADPERGETFPAAPVAWQGRVFIGNAGGDNLGVTGRMMAFDAASGGKLWSFDIVPGSGPAAATWPAETERVPRAGGATWTSYAVDTSRGLVYLPTGNTAPDFMPALHPAGRGAGRSSLAGLDRTARGRRCGVLCGGRTAADRRRRRTPRAGHLAAGERPGGAAGLRAALNRPA